MSTFVHAMSGAGAFKPDVPPVAEICGKSGCVSRWHVRYEKAAERYAATRFSPDMLDMIAAGLREWASILPQIETDRHGRHKKANSWGLAAELTVLWQLEIMLDLDGNAQLPILRDVLDGRKLCKQDSKDIVEAVAKRIVAHWGSTPEVMAGLQEILSPSTCPHALDSFPPEIRWNRPHG